MAIYLINHSWESFYKTKEYCGFIDEEERNLVKIGDTIVYFGQGIIFGVFEAISLVDNEFNGWKKKYPFQIKLKELFVIKNGIIAKQLQDRFRLLKENNRYNNLIELSEDELKMIMESIIKNQKEVVFE